MKAELTQTSLVTINGLVAIHLECATLTASNLSDKSYHRFTNCPLRPQGPTPTDPTTLYAIMRQELNSGTLSSQAA